MPPPCGGHLDFFDLGAFCSCFLTQQPLRATKWDKRLLETTPERLKAKTRLAVRPGRCLDERQPRELGAMLGVKAPRISAKPGRGSTLIQSQREAGGAGRCWLPLGQADV